MGLIFSTVPFKDRTVTVLAKWGTLGQPCLEFRYSGAGFKTLSQSESLKCFVLVMMGICFSEVISQILISGTVKGRRINIS